jgi:hypothetical protein
MNVDVEIYMSSVIKFFKDNPDELKNLVSEEKKDKFFTKVRDAAITNFEKGDEVTLTQQQLINICLELNGKSELQILENSKFIVKTKFGEYSLN